MSSRHGPTGLTVRDSTGAALDIRDSTGAIIVLG